jgi:hypothetical protein
MSDNTQHFRHSTLRERIVEHVMVGELLRHFWRRGIVDVEILRSEFDGFGYDVVLARGRIVRHVQFKTGTQKKPGKVSIAQALSHKPSGCVIWISVDDDLNLGPYYFFGSAPGEPLPDISGMKNPKRPTHNKLGERPFRQNHREVPGAKLRKIDNLDGIAEALFG